MGSLFVGIDVAKDRLDVHLQPSGATFDVARTDQGLEPSSCAGCNRSA